MFTTVKWSLPSLRSLSLVKGWPVERVAAGVVGWNHASGRIEILGTVGDIEHTQFPWTSVTKMLTALCVLEGVANGEISLDEELGPPQSTVRHVLSHASGLAPSSRSVVAKPATKRIYSNAGYELLGEFVTDRYGLTFSALLAEKVLQPLHMYSTQLFGSPASGARGPLSDLLRLTKKMLENTLHPSPVFAEATSTVFSGLDGVLPGFGMQRPCDWGLGFEIRNGKQPHWTGELNSPSTFGHFGRSGSFMWVDPEALVAVACLCDREFGPWARETWPPFADAVLTEVMEW